MVDGHQMTFREVDEYSNAVANYLYLNGYRQVPDSYSLYYSSLSAYEMILWILNDNIFTYYCFPSKFLLFMAFFMSMNCLTHSDIFFYLFFLFIYLFFFFAREMSLQFLWKIVQNMCACGWEWLKLV